MAIGGALRNVKLGRLRPDWLNPRFPPSAVDSFEDDLDVYAYLDKKFDTVSVAESIARHGFFISEPLIAIASGPNDYVVLEGNRRLTALKGLSSEDVRSRMTDPRWIGLQVAAGIDLDGETEIPVLVAESREEVAPILGYRHVTGITPWDPFQQARYVASLIDDEAADLSADQVSQLIGRDVSEVRAFYRNFSIVEQARDVFEMPDPDRITDEFGVWTRAMTSTGIRDYIRAPSPRNVQEGSYPLPDEKADQLAKLVVWLFGKPRSDADKESGRQSSDGRVITDSRQLTRLGKVLANSDGQAALERGESLKEAERAMLNQATRFFSGLDSAHSGLEQSLKVATGELVSEGHAKLAQIAGSLEAIRSQE